MKLFIGLSAALAMGVCSLAWAAPEAAPPMAAPQAAAEATLTLSVEAVSCASCNLSIRHALKKLNGVKSVQAGREANQAVVTYDAGKVKPEQIVQAINGLGFKTALPHDG